MRAAARTMALLSGALIALTAMYLRAQEVRVNAGDWYRAAAARVTGIQKIQIEDRLAAAARARALFEGK